MAASSEDPQGTAERGPAPVLCDRCLRSLQPGRGEFYIVRIEAVADPTPPEFDHEDLQRDHRQEWQRLIDSLQELSPQEALDQVYRSLSITLCTTCYRVWIENPAGN
jgi:hypothetical protein